MVYPTLLGALAVFTLLDVLTTAVGLQVGCIELNPVVMIWGVGFWAIFRILLLGGMLTVFSAIYRLCLKYFQRGLQPLKALLFLLDVYIGAVVFSGFLAIYSKLVF